jgi:hypothetical protein
LLEHFFLGWWALSDHEYGLELTIRAGFEYFKLLFLVLHELLDHFLILLWRDLTLFAQSFEASLLVLPLYVRIYGLAFGPHCSCRCLLLRSILSLSLRIGARMQSLRDTGSQSFIFRTLLMRRGIADGRGRLLRLLTFHQPTVNDLLTSFLRSLVRLALRSSLGLHTRTFTGGWLRGRVWSACCARFHDLLNGSCLLNFNLNFFDFATRRIVVRLRLTSVFLECVLTVRI